MFTVLFISAKPVILTYFSEMLNFFFFAAVHGIPGYCQQNELNNTLGGKVCQRWGGSDVQKEWFSLPARSCACVYV